MKLSPGTRLGPYEILSRLGAGGMGEVFRARDTRLGREVALKVLPEAFVADPDRLRRFERESRAASAIADPHVVAVFDVGEESGVHFFVSELVDGTTLREAMEESLPLPRTLDYAGQIAAALASAHARGVVHRDLKPENVLLTRSGFVKLADFGLAKVVGPALPGSGSLTAELAATESGSVMGTVAYMSPEQARGAAVDHRSDQFSFGSILYEMIAGRPAFRRESAAETLSAILRDEPLPLSETEAPEVVRWVVARCLAKDPDRRYASTGDLARELESLPRRIEKAPRGLAAAAPRAGRSRAAAALVALASAAAGFGVARLVSLPAAPAISTFRDVTFSGRDSSPSASPDGRRIAFTSDRDGRSRIWIEQLADGSEAPLTAGPDTNPRISPDGEQVLFSRAEEGRTVLYRAALVGGEPRRIVADAVEGDWSPDGRRIAYLRWRKEGSAIVYPVGVVDADGGGAREVTVVRGHPLLHPRWSPDGKTIAASEASNGGAPCAIFLIDAATGGTRSIPPPRRTGWLSAVAWVGPDALVYSQADSATASVTGSAGRIVRQDVRTGKAQTLLWTPANAQVLDVLAAGRLVFDVVSMRENLRELTLSSSADPAGVRWITRGASDDRQPAYSPDGAWLIFSSNRSGNLDLWKIAPASGTMRRLTDDPADDWDPAFAPDGKHVLWSSNRGGPFEVWSAEPDGTGARQITRDGVDAENPTETPDGRWIAYASFGSEKLGLWKIRPDGSDATRLVRSVTIAYPETSPDGAYVAYRVNDDPARCSVHVCRLSDGKPTPFLARLEIRKGYASTSVGRVRWTPDGKTVVFVGQDEHGAYGLYRQDFDPARDTSETLRPFGAFDPEVANESFGISPDGKRLTVAGWEQLSTVRVAENVGAFGRGR
ncbi:MAG TPA: protein kinase [Thermoanaerobaculia bacterium]|nr:protein kinase [Thermoanaerobaculia bacterium]